MATATKSTAKAEDELTSQIAVLKSDIAELTAAVGDVAKAQASALGQKAAATGEKINDQAHQLFEQTNDYVAREPIKAVGIAAGIGFLAGLLLARR